MALGASNVSKNGGAKATNGRVVKFSTGDCPTKASPTEIDVTSYVQLYILPESVQRRFIFQDDDTNISTNIVGANSLLLNANEALPLDVAGLTNNLYVSVEDGGSAETDGLRIVYIDE